MAVRGEGQGHRARRRGGFSGYSNGCAEGEYTGAGIGLALCQRIVEHYGKTATQFFDAADADENAPCPDVVLLDLNLPKKSGDDVLKHLRASRRCRNATVLIVSSSDAPRDRNAVASFGIAGYFKKPSDYGEYMKLGPLVKGLLDAPVPAEVERK